MPNVILTKPLGTTNIPGTSIFNIPLAGSSSAPYNIVTLDKVKSKAVKWIYTIVDTVSGQILMGEVMAVHNAGSPEPEYTQYGLVGTSISHTINVSIVGADMVFEITNLQINPLTVSLIRIQI